MKTSILFTGSNEFPFGSAVVQRQMQLANILIDMGYNVTVVNRRGAHLKAIHKREGIKRNGSFKGINYFFGSQVPYKSVNFFYRNLLKPLGFLGELFFIFYSKFFKKAKYIFNNSINLNQLKYYYFLSKLLRLELVYDYVEFVSSLGEREMINKDQKEDVFDYKFFRYTDKIIVISSFLEAHVKRIVPSIQLIKVPPIIDFSYYDKFNSDQDENMFFLFCGSTSYFDLILFVIDSFKNISSKSMYFNLILVLNGSDSDLENVNEYIIENMLKRKVTVQSKIPYTDLIALYKSSRALLIPFSNNLQDQARFPFKICEYLASKRPIITSDVPLINEFFEDRKTAFISKVNDVKDFSGKMYEVVENLGHAKKVGAMAYEMGKERFDYKIYTWTLEKFLKA